MALFLRLLTFAMITNTKDYKYFVLHYLDVTFYKLHYTMPGLKRKRGRSLSGLRYKRRRFTKGRPRTSYKYRIRKWPKTVYNSNFVPQRTVAKLTYAETVSMVSGASGVPAYHYFCCNGLYDPNTTGTGHQPMGFDQLMAKYNHYRVLGSKIQIKILPTQTTDTIKTVYNSNFVPQRTVAKLTYAETVSMVSGASGVPAYHYFCCNGLYDPNTTGTGHQPMGFDQLMAKYNHYRVLGSKIQIKILPTQTTDTTDDIALIGLTVTPDSSSTVTNSEELREQKGTKYTLAPRQAQGIKALSMGWGAKRTFGTKAVTKDMFGAIASNPLETSFWRITMTGDLGTATALTLFIRIVYLAEFIEPIMQSGS